jgi:chemotaxis protein MotB
MSMIKRRSEDDRENLDRWIITYADLITLLLAFFIMLYTFSKQDARKYEELSGRLKTIFQGGRSVLKTGGGAQADAAGTQGQSSASGEIERELEEELAALAEAKDEAHKISVFKDERGIVIRAMDTAFFDEGRADLKEAAKGALKRIAPTIEKSRRHVRIEGHTDNVPINTKEFKTNWELSARRATEVVRHLIEKYNFPPERISASGYAEYRPLAANDTPRNRAVNRRIEIILLKGPENPPPAG